MDRAKDKENTVVLNNKFNFSDCRTLFFTSHALKILFELLRVKFYRNDLKGNKSYFELAGGSSYRG